MKVLHIIKGLGLAGAEKHLVMLLAGLRAQGIDARLLLWVSPIRQADDIMAACAEAGIPVERWVMPGHIAPRFFLRLWAYLRRERPDIVHTHLIHAETYAIPAARLAGVRYVVNSAHNDDPFRRPAVMRLRGRLLWGMTSRGIAISEHIRRFLIEVEGARPSQVQTIHYGLSLTDQTDNLPREALPLPPDARLIGSVCRLVAQKGLPDALRAFALIQADYPTLHYLIVGEGGLKADLQALAHELGIAERVHFLGWRADAPALMRHMEIFIAPSLWEGFGLVFLEAMSVGRPVVATRVSAIPEVVEDGVTGYLVSPNAPEELAAALRRLLDNPEKAAQMGAAGQARLHTHFNPQRMIDQTAHLYREVMQ